MTWRVIISITPENETLLLSIMNKSGFLAYLSNLYPNYIAIYKSLGSWQIESIINRESLIVILV